MNIAVLYGGTSAEVDVSRRSGVAIADGLRRKNHSITELDWQEQRVIADVELLRKFDVVFIGYHGGAGEDGHIQAVLELANIPFTGSGSVASALGMDKILSKKLFERDNIPTAPWDIVYHYETPADALHKAKESGFELPIVVKPQSQGSTVGVTIVESEDELQIGLRNAFKFGKKAILEKYIHGREVTVAILGDEPMPVVEIVPEGGFYDYEHKYTSGKSQYVCPAQIDERVSQKLQTEALKAYRALGCRHYARVDFRLSPNDQIFCLEVNTLPGMTDLSLVPMAARERGIEFPELVHRIAMMAYDSR